jgi:hypothetical protein
MTTKGLVRKSWIFVLIIFDLANGKPEVFSYCHRLHGQNIDFEPIASTSGLIDPSPATYCLANRHLAS